MGGMVLATLAAAVVVGEPAAAAAGPAVVQTASNFGSNSTVGSSVSITTTLGKACTAGDTLVAFVTVGQQVGDAGAVTVTPAGWTRLYEHAPSSHVAEYHGWFGLSACAGVSSATFTISAPGNPDGTAGSVVLTEYSGLPSSIVVEFGSNNGDGGGATNGTLAPGVSAPTGTVVLTALSLYSPSVVSGTPSGWSTAGSETGGSLPAWEYWENGAGQVPAPSFNWSPASAAWEISMVVLEAAPAGAPPNVAQEVSGGFSSSASWALTLPHAVAAGDALVALILSDASRSGSGFEASSVTGGGVTWQQVTGFGASGSGTAEIWVGFSSGGTTGPPTVTAGLRSSADGQMVISEVSGIAGVDITSTNSGSSTEPTASISPTAGDFMVSGMAAPGTSLIGHPTPQWSTYSISTSPAYAGEWWSSVPNGTTSPLWFDTSSSAWTVVAAAFTASGSATTPTVTGVSPSTGPTAGGTTVTVTGTHFTGATSVHFGTTPGTGLVVNSPTSITIVSPVDPAAAVDVTVTTSGGGTSAANPPKDQFTFLPPSGVAVVGSFASTSGSVTTMADDPQLLGDVLVVFAQRASGTTVTAVSGGGVTTWHKAVQFAGSTGADEELWYGTVTSTGSSTITFTWSTSITGHTAEYGAQEFTAGLGAGTVWSLDKTGTLNGASGTSIPFPSLTAAGTGELYFGYTVPNDTAVSGTTSGFTYAVTPEDNIATYDTSVSGTVAPTASQSPASTASSVALLLTASGGTPPPAPTVTGLSPSSGSTGGGTTVTLTGTNFTGATAVHVRHDGGHRPAWSTRAHTRSPSSRRPSRRGPSTSP